MPAIAPPDNPLDVLDATKVALPELTGAGVPNPVVTVGEMVEVMMTPVTEVPRVPAVAPAPVTVTNPEFEVQVPTLQYWLVAQHMPPQSVVMPA
jgi:hypothetical protein